MVGWHHHHDSVNMSLSKFQDREVKAREAWCAAVHWVTKNWTGLSDRMTTTVF